MSYSAEGVRIRMLLAYLVASIKAQREATVEELIKESEMLAMKATR